MNAQTKPKSCHVSVLEREVVEFLGAKDGGTFLDCTFGGGGHARAILNANPKNTVFAIDRDARALERAAEMVAEANGRLQLKRGSFKELGQIFSGQKFDGILADLGLSSDQLDEERGFSFDDDAALDMRMDETQELKADYFVNQAPEKELFKILKIGGADKEAHLAAKAIVNARPIRTAKTLAHLLQQALARLNPAKKTHPATVVFQAIRIAVNDELGQINSLMAALPALSKDGTRLVVISFHSLEDKYVAQKMRAWATTEFSASFPGSGSKEKILGKVVTRKFVLPSEHEIGSNPRARSARLRAFEFQFDA